MHSKLCRVAARPGCGEAQDNGDRTAADVLRSASSLLGDAPGADSVCAATEILRCQGIVWAWQMREMDASDWSGVPAGLKCAARTELKRQQPANASGTAKGPAPPPLTEEQRRFLLVPTADGQPQPLKRASALFVLLTLVRDPQRQQGLCIVAGEVLVVINALLLPLPLHFMRQPAETAGWASMPTSDQASNAVCLACLGCPLGVLGLE